LPNEDVMNLQDIQMLYDHNCWATEQILNAAGKISAEQLTAQMQHSNYGSLRGTLVHTLDAEESYLHRMAEGANLPDLMENEFPTIEPLAARWKSAQAKMRAYLATLKDEDLDGIAVYHVGEIRRERVRWHIFAQLFSHSTQHRAEAAVMLTDLGQSPGDIDFIMWVDRVTGA
jgi:uncharacterized damage-inducible protein DinB